MISSTHVLWLGQTSCAKPFNNQHNYFHEQTLLSWKSTSSCLKRIVGAGKNVLGFLQCLHFARARLLAKVEVFEKPVAFSVYLHDVFLGIHEVVLISLESLVLGFL